MAANEQLIRIFGAREHNLKGVDLELPRGRLIVFTGVSGSGKTSLAMDTIYAEGQRRYVESLSTYARQFFANMGRPQVDHVDGLSPAIAIDQRSSSGNQRSTVATITDIHDYLRVLYARAGQVFCYSCGRPVNAHTPQQIADRVLALDEDTRVHILAPAERIEGQQLIDIVREARRQGFVRLRIDGEIYDISEGMPNPPEQFDRVEVVVDRLVIREGIEARLADSIDTALEQGGGLIVVDVVNGEDMHLSTRFSCPECGIAYPELTPAMFSFNSPAGMCPDCDGLGTQRGLDPDRLVADPGKSILDGALEIYGDVQTRHVRHILEGLAEHYGFDLSTPWRDLSEQAREIILYGTEDEISFEYQTRGGKSFEYSKRFEGLIPASQRRYRDTSSSGQKKFYDRFFAKLPCPACGGSRLRPESRAVRVGDRTIAEIMEMTAEEAVDFFEHLELPPVEVKLCGELLGEIRARLRFMVEVGVGYLSLGRTAPSLAGGEAQRIRLATQLGSGLAGILYILDEPSVGLHPVDHDRLLGVLERLRDIGNTVIVVEHDAETILRSDWVVDFGPGPGVRGGEVIYAGTVEGLLQSERSLTGRYLSGRRGVPVPEERRAGIGKSLIVRGASQFNLRGVDAEIPLGTLTCVTGVSGSGKSTLVQEILHKALRRRLHRSLDVPGEHRDILGAEHLERVVSIDQEPIGRTPRSNPATYSRALAPIRELFAAVPEARMRGYEPGRFSFNVTGGRCEACQGTGTRMVEMHMLPDVYVPCDQCEGTRYNRETLQIRYKGKNIAEVLELTITEAMELFQNVPKVHRILETLDSVGLGYLKLGQPATTLSGGEAQRLKLATELARPEAGHTLYILDEPTTGLHFADIDRLLDVLGELVDAGNTVMVIEHNLEVIKCADHVIDLGPGGGDSGGRIVATGTPEEVAEEDASITGRFLRTVLESAARAIS
ncbi:MAG: excinuclease ABC subunit UvrA [candidate division WS1 bacterium]|nr:excinuclease ABC subunit UvrA [candidate division WS1 bacterium]